MIEHLTMLQPHGGADGSDRNCFKGVVGAKPVGSGIKRKEKREKRMNTIGCIVKGLFGKWWREVGGR